MATVANRRSVISLYSDPLDPYSHQVRIVLAEKGVTVDIINVDFNNKCEDLYDLNPYGTLPTLVDRDLILYESRIILEYLDERFPHPPLMPVYPVARAETRRMIFRIEQDWYSKMKIILNSKDTEANQARKEIVDTLLNIAPVFANKLYFLSDEFSLMDCWLAPLLWRLDSLQIELPSGTKAIQDYAKRLFMRESFRASLTDPERELRAFA